MKIKYYLIGIIIIIIDQITKALLINKAFAIIPNVVEFNYNENKAAALGIGNRIVVIIISLVIILGIIIYLITNKDKIISFWPYTFILSGAVGNLIDRVVRGFVIDFIDVCFLKFPIFNIADIFVTIGLLGIIITGLKKKTMI